MTKTEELLAVLDLPENDQISWLMHIEKLSLNKSLSDLAFRLRDEVKEKWHNEYCKAKEVVWLYKNEDAQRFKRLAETYYLNEEVDRIIQRREVFFTNHAQPIHWIIAALIAKENNGKDSQAEIRKESL